MQDLKRVCFLIVIEFKKIQNTPNYLWNWVALKPQILILIMAEDEQRLKVGNAFVSEFIYTGVLYNYLL